MQYVFNKMSIIIIIVIQDPPTAIQLAWEVFKLSSKVPPAAASSASGASGTGGPRVAPGGPEWPQLVRVGVGYCG